MSKVIRNHIPLFLDAPMHRYGEPASDFLRESLQMFLEHFEDDIKGVGMHQTKTVGFRMGEEDMQSISSDIRLPQALRMALIWRLGVEHGKTL